MRKICNWTLALTPQPQLELFLPAIHQTLAERIHIASDAALGGREFFVERRQKVEGDVSGLKFPWVSMRNVVYQRSERRRARRRNWLCASASVDA